MPVIYLGQGVSPTSGALTSPPPSPTPCRPYASQPRANRIPKGAYIAPPGMGERGSNLRVTMISSNLIAEPYKGALPRLPLSSWVTPSGWKERWRRWMSNFKSVYTLSKVRKNVKGWTLPGFKEEALKIYTEACGALAAADRTALRQLVSPAVFTDMKRQIKQREDGGWKRVQWAMTSTPTLQDIEVVHGRLIAADPKNDDTAFAQLTVRFKSGQTFAAYDGRGRLVAGSEGEGAEMRVEDFWVFERPLKGQTANRWRVAGRLTIPPPGTAANVTAPAQEEPAAVPASSL